MVLDLKSGITLIRTRPEALPRLSTATKDDRRSSPLELSASAETGLLAANPRFINFYLAVQRFSNCIHHCLTALVKHHPGGLVTGQSKLPLYKQGIPPRLSVVIDRRSVNQ